MASVLLHSVGAAVGNALIPGIGGAFFGVLGRGLGGAIDNQIGLGTSVTGPRLASLSVQDSRYGAGIPIVYGTARVAGNVIWSTDLIQTTHNTGIFGGKGGALSGSANATTYTYSVHCAVGISIGPIGGISTIWADSTIIYQNGVWTSGIIDSATIYTGSSTQMPDAFMQSIIGGNIPAYRGLAYIVFDNLRLANFGNRLPNLTFEISPATTTSNPSWTRSVDAGFNECPQTARNNGMAPITLSGNGTSVNTVLVGGYLTPGSVCTFVAAEYDVTGTTPTLISQTESASFTTGSSISDGSWALSPDNRFVAMMIQSGSSPTDNFIIYDTVNKQFGAVYSLSLDTATPKQIAWIDAQHFVIDNDVGGVRGLHVFARAGLNIIDLGFFGVWGAGSSTTHLPLYYTQFTPFAGGLINYMTDPPSGSAYFTTIYACPIAWQNNALVVGTPYVVVSGLTAGSSGAGEHANLVATGDNEWTLCLGTVQDFHLISFVPGLASATVTRPWQDFTPSVLTGTMQIPLWYGDRLVIVQRNAYDNYYRLSEVMLNSGSYTLTIDSLIVGNSAATTANFGATVIDTTRLLLQGVRGFANDIKQLGIIQRCATGLGLDTITGDILTRAGYVSGDYDVTALSGTSVAGFVLPEPMSARSALQPLQVYTPFDIVETAGELKAVLRHGTADMVIASTEWRAGPDHKEPPPALQVTRAQELDLPLEIDVDYIDASRDFEVNSQRARRGATHAQSIQKINLPVVCTATQAKQIAETRLYTMWAERELVQLSVSRSWLALDVGDVVDLGNGDLLRVTNIHQAGGLLTVGGFYVTEATYGSAAVADTGATVNHAALVPVASTLALMDLPLLQATDDQPGMYAAVTGLPGWTSASLLRSADGVNYSTIATLSSLAVMGIAATTLGNGPGTYMDNMNSVNVQIMNGTLASCSAIDLLNGANAALLGSEILQFQTATLTAPGLYSLSNLLRGRRGTESTTNTHVIGETFVLLQSAAVEFVPALLTDRGASYDFRALTKGQMLSDAQDTVFTYALGTIQPFAPVNITGMRLAGTGTDLTLVWMRRARLNAEWVSYVDVPLDEPYEQYEVDIMNGANAMRVFSGLSSPTVTYTAGEQTADWGTVPATFTVNVYQISSRFGRGRAGVAVV